VSFVPAHEIVAGAQAERCAFVLHGILGSRRNWLSFARRAADAFPRWRFVLVDLRNHGESHGAAGPHDLAACARDLAELAAHLGEEPAWISGHSFGGKVALTYGRDYAGALEHLWVLDATPGPRLGGGASSVERVFEILREVELPIAGRSELVADLQSRGLSLAIARWMTTNLTADGAGGFKWRFNLDACVEMLESYAKEDLWPMLEAPPSGQRLHVLQGALSDRWTGEDEARLRALAERASISHHVLENAGHWVHTDNPEGLFEALGPSLAEAAGR
jgi:pimeloyl-ACP methyl ester carboxylesterase